MSRSRATALPCSRRSGFATDASSAGRHPGELRRSARGHRRLGRRALSRREDARARVVRRHSERPHLHRVRDREHAHVPVPADRRLRRRVLLRRALARRLDALPHPAHVEAELRPLSRSRVRPEGAAPAARRDRRQARARRGDGRSAGLEGDDGRRTLGVHAVRTPGAAPFVHALDTVGRRAFCIDLPLRLAQSKQLALRLHLRAGGELLVARGRSALAVVDTTRLAARRVS